MQLTSSICGPVLYLAYPSTFPEAIPNRENCGRTLDLHGYADDYGVKNESKVCKTNHTDENASVRVMEDCASKIKQVECLAALCRAYVEVLFGG